jgi:hypothetical protein
MKKRPSTAKGLLFGVFLSAEGPQAKDIICKRYWGVFFSVEGPRDEEVFFSTEGLRDDDII